MLRLKLAVLPGAIGLSLFILVALLAPLISPYAPDQVVGSAWAGSRRKTGWVPITSAAICCRG